MWRLVEYAAACVAPAAILIGCDKAVRAWIAPQRSHTSAPSPAPRDIGRLSSDLTRLYAELDVLRASRAAARVHRLRATTLAYDDVLEACCTALQVDDGIPEREWSAIERLEVEATLEDAGLRW